MKRRPSEILLQPISREKFARYGKVIEFRPDDPDQIGLEGMQAEIVSRSEEPTGWRIIILRVQQRVARRLEQHPNSKESFEPMAGVAVLLVAPPESPNHIEAFILDKPVILNEGVWHEILTISDESTLKIVENMEVESMHSSLMQPLCAKAG